MAKNKLPTPAEARASVDPSKLKGFARLRNALARSGGDAFNYDADLLPMETEEDLLKALKAAGWKYKFVSEPRDGSYYEISPGKALS